VEEKAEKMKNFWAKEKPLIVITLICQAVTTIQMTKRTKK